MTSRKPGPKKRRIVKKTLQNRRVPLWAVAKTHRKVRSHPKARSWRASKIKV